MTAKEMRELKNTAASSAMEWLLLGDDHSRAVERLLDGAQTLQEYFHELKERCAEGGSSDRALPPSDEGSHPGTAELVNKPGLTQRDALFEAERVVVSFRSVEILCAPCESELDFDFYRSLNERLFGDIYECAGLLRDTAARRGMPTGPETPVGRYCRDLFQQLADCGYYRESNREDFASRITELYHDLNMLAPFATGSSRTLRVYITLLIRSAGYDFDIACCPDEFERAALISQHGELEDLHAYFGKAIKQGAHK